MSNKGQRADVKTLS
uniref:Uncharacterized protein n=1 Tax=Arundo donax TaxID=35708 RepID=A0A0A9EGN2_ARUDO